MSESLNTSLINCLWGLEKDTLMFGIIMNVMIKASGLL